VSISNFIEKFAYAIEVPEDSLSDSTEFKQLEVWDSLNTLAVISMADTDFNVALSGKDIENSRTVGDLWRIIEAKTAKA
jgi:acyl carrier protein